MRYGYVLPYGDARSTMALAKLAEDAGWDGFFVWEPVWGIDAWVSLAAAAVVTDRIRLGTMLSPVSRMRPAKLASETATLDNLSDGRVILSVGLGAVDTGWAEFGEETDVRLRAERMDETLDIVTGLWAGQPFAYEGRHYRVQPCNFIPPPPPRQQPIPVWVVGLLSSPRSMARAARYGGLLASVRTDDGSWRSLEPADLRAARTTVTRLREGDPGNFDFIVEGEASTAAEVEPWIDAGATWWIESMWSVQNESDAADRYRRRIEAGPPVS